MTHDEKKASEDLLAGFDRPGRSPRAPRVQSKFIDFSGAAVDASLDPRRGKDTALITRARRAGWLPWVGVAVVLLATCSAVAWIALRAPAPRPPVLSPVVTTVTTVVTPVTPVTPEPPATPSVIVAPPPVASASAPPVARSAAAPRASAPPPEDPRVDFVRNL